ncbi:MAG: hypothetical protein B7X95_01370 [Methylophilaceae bacterium 17-44-8]|nr:MAG: hypothetical protein B7X95_01370 [Methylophilaceae bacterium 17-44-8]
MKVLINPIAETVTVDGLSRNVAVSMLDETITEINYDTAVSFGTLLRNGQRESFGKTVFNNLYAQYVQRWKAAGIAPARSLEQVKNDKREQINSHRDNLEQSGFPYQDKIIDSNPVSVQRITVAVQAAQAAIGAGQPFAITWTCQDNSILNLDAVGMMGMPVALAMFANNLHETARAKKELIDAALTVEEVEAVTWA